jgi:Protein of unknown function (DUF3037)
VPESFDYAIVRVVPRVERGEFVNVGIIVACATKRFLAATIALDADRVRALDPHVDIAEIEAALAAIPLIAAGDRRGGPVAALPTGERFHWLVAPRSAVIQPSPVHTGLCDDPMVALGELVDRLVRPVR